MHHDYVAIRKLAQAANLDANLDAVEACHPPRPTASHSCPVRIMVPTPLRPDPSRTSITQTHGMSGPGAVSCS